MKREDIFLILFLVILATSLVYIYQNLESLDCYIDYSYGDLMSDINYEFEPEGSLFGKTKIFRFLISSNRNRLEYFGMEIKDGQGEILFFENITNPEGGSLSASIEVGENETVIVKRFFKKMCYPEVEL
jgi:hypothetical protein